MGEQHFNFLAQSSRGAAFPRACDLTCFARVKFLSVVDRFELAAINRNAGVRPAKHNEPGADLTDGMAIVLAEIGNRLVIGSKPARQPHHFKIASSLSLKPPARLNPIEIAVNMKLQQDRRMIRRPSSCLGSDPTEPQTRPDRVRRQKRQSPERDYSRRSSHPGIQETARSARDPYPQRSDSSDHPQKCVRITPRESDEAGAFLHMG